MTIRKVQLSDAAALVDLMKALDEETKFMMLEPGERQTTAGEQEKIIEGFLGSTAKVMFVVESGTQIGGFVVGAGKTAQRVKHVMACVIGVRRTMAGKGVGNQLMTHLETWAEAHAFTRLELTVMAHNERAIRLYSARGFELEGTKRNAMRVDGEYVDELYMSKLLDE